MVVYRQGRRRRISLILIVVTSLALISLDQSGAGVVSTARTAAQNIVSPLQNLVDDAINPVTNFFDSLGRADELEAENAQLRRKLAAAEGAVAEGQAATRQLEEIKGLLDIPQIADYDGIVASVVDGPVDNFSRTLQLDKGSDAGIAVDMPVIVTGGALIGRVVQVSKTRSTVLRLDDPQFGVAVQLLQPDRVGPKGFARGQRSSTLLTLQTLESSQTAHEGRARGDAGLGELAVPQGARGRHRDAQRRRRDRDPAESTTEAGRRSRPPRPRQGAALLATADTVIRYLRLALVVITAVVLQTTLFTHLRIDGVVPDVGLVCVLAVAYEDGPDTGAWFGFVDGPGDRLFLTTPLGLSALSFALTGYAVGVFQAGMVRTTPRLAPILGFVGGLFGGLVFITVGALVGQSGFLSFESLKTVLIAAVYDAPDCPDCLPRGAPGCPPVRHEPVAGPAMSARPRGPARSHAIMGRPHE